jgi:hypothetical protein
MASLIIGVKKLDFTHVSSRNSDFVRLDIQHPDLDSLDIWPTCLIYGQIQYCGFETIFLSSAFHFPSVLDPDPTCT